LSSRLTLSPLALSVPTLRAPRSTRFPYTTLFRSLVDRAPSLPRAAEARSNLLRELLDELLDDLSHELARHREDLGVHQMLRAQRSEEHTSELQSPDHLVCRLLLEKKKTKRSSREH